MDFVPANIPSKLLRDNFAEIADATLAGRRFVVTRNGRPRLALVSLDDLQVLRDLEDKADLRIVKKRRNEPRTPWEEVKKRLGLDKPSTQARTRR